MLATKRLFCCLIYKPALSLYLSFTSTLFEIVIYNCDPNRNPPIFIGIIQHSQWAIFVKYSICSLFIIIIIFFSMRVLGCGFLWPLNKFMFGHDGGIHDHCGKMSRWGVCVCVSQTVNCRLKRLKPFLWHLSKPCNAHTHSYTATHIVLNTTTCFIRTIIATMLSITAAL